MAKMGLKFWKKEGPGALWSAGFSAVAHAILLAAWVAAAGPSNEPRPENAIGRVLYLPPPNPEPARAGSAEAVRYVELAPEGFGAGMGTEGVGVELDVGQSDDASIGNIGLDSVTAGERDGSEGIDSVFTIIDVDSAATRLPESAAPRYPSDLLARRVEGQAIVQFVVDTTGLADPGSFVVVLASHPDFAQSVRDALPGMRFSTARIGRMKVRQLVELPFSFNIAEPPPTPAESPPGATRRRPG